MLFNMKKVIFIVTLIMMMAFSGLCFAADGNDLNKEQKAFYDENWSELKINVGEFTGNKGTLFVASNGTNYAQIAFKNLGIYDNQILSKDDCIKAYNYLQTLKAK